MFVDGGETGDAAEAAELGDDDQVEAAIVGGEEGAGGDRPQLDVPMAEDAAGGLRVEISQERGQVGMGLDGDKPGNSVPQGVRHLVSGAGAEHQGATGKAEGVGQLGRGEMQQALVGAVRRRRHRAAGIAVDENHVPLRHGAGEGQAQVVGRPQGSAAHDVDAAGGTVVKGYGPGVGQAQGGVEIFVR